MTSNDFTSIDVFCALDVGKLTHHGTALLADGRTAFDKPLPNGEPQLRELFARRRVGVLHATLKHRTLYQPGHEQGSLTKPIDLDRTD